ncbi:MAG: HEAT repeat domain-containing protein, partial [Planctomycetota bacterium]|nr:HEAT repeat domain-containing protein [Planctomycetota bacterium]
LASSFALASLGALAACGSTANAPTELVPLEELPAEYRSILIAYGRGGPEWEELRPAILADPDRAGFLVDNLVLEMVRAYQSSNLARLGQPDGPYERARDELVRFADTSTPVLVDLLGAKDGVVPVIMGEVLKDIGRPCVLAVAGQLDLEDPNRRRYVVELLADLPHAGKEEDAVLSELAELLAEDREWIVRAQAARTLGFRGRRHVSTRTACAGLLRGLVDEDPTVAREAAGALGTLADPEAIPAVLNYLERTEREGDLRGNETGQGALQALTGQRGRRKARAWRDFWREHRRELLGSGASGPY